MCVQRQQAYQKTGCYIPTPADATARDREIALENVFFEHDLTTFDSSLVESGDIHADPFRFRLSSPADAEDHYRGTIAVEQMTKMALARKLEVTQGMDRWEAWRGMSKLGLLVALNPAYVAPAPPVLAGGGGGGGGGGGKAGGGRAGGGRGRGGKAGGGGRGGGRAGGGRRGGGKAGGGKAGGGRARAGKGGRAVG